MRRAVVCSIAIIATLMSVPAALAAPPTCKLAKADKPGPLNVSKSCMKCLYQCTSGGSMAGGGMNIVRFQKGSLCIDLKGISGWAPGYMDELACDKSMGSSAGVFQGDMPK
jgi:hypothetical protein